MPIAIPCDGTEPLAQGDLLSGVAFAMTSAEGKLTSDARAKYLLVVSRPCSALRDGKVVVAAVHESKLDLSKVRQQLAGPRSGDAERVTLDRMRRFLAGVRDGGQLTDSFYLGNIEPGSQRRYAADLGALSTILVPTSTPEARAQWVNTHRIWKMGQEFVRDLHVRLFNTFARLGFDDYQWFADPDLEILITDGEAELAELRTALAEAERAVQTKEANGDSIPKQLAENVEKRRVELEDANRQLKPYLDERARRRTPGT